MEHYNLLLVETESPGLRVIQTREYQNLIRVNPGFVHENCGDFYSNVPVDELSAVVYRALDKEFMGMKLNQNLIIVDALTFNPAIVEIEKDYVVRENDGIRFYSPELHTPDAKNASPAYVLLGLMFVGSLFSDEQQGTLQVSLGILEERLKSLLEKLRD